MLNNYIMDFFLGWLTDWFQFSNKTEYLDIDNKLEKKCVDIIMCSAKKVFIIVS